MTKQMEIQQGGITERRERSSSRTSEVRDSVSLLDGLK